MNGSLAARPCYRCARPGSTSRTAGSMPASRRPWRPPGPGTGTRSPAGGSDIPKAAAAGPVAIRRVSTSSSKRARQRPRARPVLRARGGACPAEQPACSLTAACRASYSAEPPAGPVRPSQRLIYSLGIDSEVHTPNRCFPSGACERSGEGYGGGAECSKNSVGFLCVRKPRGKRFFGWAKHAAYQHRKVIAFPTMSWPPSEPLLTIPRQIPRFIPAPRSCKIFSLHFSQCVEGRTWGPWARGGIEEARVFAGDQLCNGEEIRHVPARFDARQSLIN